MPQTLPVSRVVNIDLSLTPTQAAFPNLSTVLILGTSDSIDTVTRMKSYSDLEEVGVDFSTTDEEYLAAQLWFAQSPQPDNVLIGRWANAATPGELIGGTVDSGDRVVGGWTGIANGSITVSFDGAAVIHVNGLDFSAAANMNAVAAVINTGLGVNGGCVWDAVNNRFVISSDTTGATSSVSFLTAGNAGTDISTKMKGRDGEGGYLVPGLAAQSALATVTLFDNMFSSQWYGLDIPSLDDADLPGVAAYVEASSIPHFLVQNTQDEDCIDPASTTDVMYLAKQAAYTRTAIQYSSTSLYAVISMLARILTTNWLGSNTTITLMFKEEPLVVAENLSTTEADAIDAKNGNVYVAYNNDTSIIQSGITPSGQFIDTVIGCDWLRGAIQTACYNGLRTQPKVPQTNAGMHYLGTLIESVCVQAVTNGLAAPGIWTGPSFGQLKTGDTLPKGYYIYVPPLSSQSQTDRAARKSVPIQVAIKLAGAVQHVDVIVNVNP